MSSQPPFPALHHIALTVTDPETSRAWYCDVLGSDAVLDEDVTALPGHHKGFRHILFALPSGSILGLHSHADTDRCQTFDELRPGLDHVGFGCRDHDELVRLRDRLDVLGVEHGGIAEDALGFGLSFRDPDGIALELWAARS